MTEDNHSNHSQQEAPATASASVSFNVTMGQPLSADPKDNVILVGTAHVSERSIREVEEAIDRYRPDVVAVELDERRFQALQQPESAKKDIQIKELLKGNNLMVFLLQWLLAYVQRKVGVQAGVRPGAEMMAAVEAAQRRGMAVALIDRDIGITLNRVWAKMSLREKFRIFSSLVLAMLGYGKDEIDLDEITKEDVVESLLEELKDYAPSMSTVLVEERNAYLAHNLLEIGRTKRVVAAIGAGHREGIRKYLEHPETIPPMASLVEVPQKRKIGFFKILSALIVLSVVAIFGLLLLSGIPLTELLLAVLILFIAQGVLSALLVALIGGHWKSVATAFALAWYGFLNPVLAIGWLAGVVEATQRPPTMNDLNTLLGKDEDGLLDTFRNMLKNRLFKAILVAALANVGSMIGTVVGAAILVYYFHLTDPVTLLQNGVSTGWNAVSSFFGSMF
ncbi:MAG: TraB family protein [Methanocella sp. PtaU1.Bin125]|nr:MAG: TraB family protein [Methanocella sp. PtaU1.Bin125]